MNTHIQMLQKKNKILTYLENNKSEIIPCVAYADFECLLMKKDSCQNNTNNSYTEKKAVHIPCGYSINLVSSFDSNKNEQFLQRKRLYNKLF